MKLPITITRRRYASTVFGAATCLVLAAWAARHTYLTIEAMHGHGSQFGLLFTIGFVWVVAQTVLYYAERPIGAWQWHEREVLSKLHVTVPVPVYNEDPELLRRCLSSLLTQDRLPDLIFVVDDGSTAADYSAVQSEFARTAAGLGVRIRWTRVPNGGKRHAQGVAFVDTPGTDIYITVDSDALLDPYAVREILRPFRDERVQSVAGIVLASNATRNVMTRMLDLWFVTSQLVTRSGMSALGSVLVNSGPLAAYRADVVRDNLDGYLNETFMGRAVGFSDDSLLTLYAKMRGRTVQQPSAISMSTFPETVNHHMRVYVRWMRGSFIRSCWRARYLPLNSAAFWIHTLSWTQMMMSALLIGTLLVVAPLAGAGAAPYMAIVAMSLGLMQAFRYMNYRRSDVSTAQQLLTLATFPLAAAWAFFVLRGIRWYGIATCLKTGWGTRKIVEVRAEPAAA